MTIRKMLALTLTATLFIGSVCNTALAHKHHDHDDAATSATETKSVVTLLTDFRRDGDDQKLREIWPAMAATAARANTDATTLIDTAFVAQALHEFQTARDLLHRVLDRQPGNDQAWLLVAALDVLAGEHGAAAQACQRLSSVPIIVRISCKAQTATTRSDQAEYLRVLTSWLAAAPNGALRGDTLAWVHRVAGDLAVATNKPAVAEAHYRGSLTHADQSQVRAALADVLLAANRWEAAAAVLPAKHVSLAVTVRRLIAERALCGDNCIATEAAMLDKRLRQWIDTGDLAHAREMARFYFDVAPDHALARELAATNFRSQQEPEDRRLLARRVAPAATAESQR